MIRQMVFSRPRYFKGRLLTADDLELEQRYLRDKQRFRNLYTHGIGIVSGLSVDTEDDGTSISISPGLAVDNLGREICVLSAVKSELPTATNRLLVWLSYAEVEAQPSPVLGNQSDGDSLVENTRIEEGFEVNLTPLSFGKRAALEPVVSGEGPGKGIPLALLQRKGKRWMIEVSGKRSGRWKRT